jgi:hypothetical protein
MVFGLIAPDEEEELYKKLVGYYANLYPGINFSRMDIVLNLEQIGNLLYTYAGEEGEATAAEKIRMINEAIGHGYSTPLIILRKKQADIILDGHRRARVAWSLGMDWPAIIIVPDKETEFGIESMVMGKIKDLF